MIDRLFKTLLSAIVLLALSMQGAQAQFKEEAFTQSYNNAADTTARDSTAQGFTFKEYFGGLSHKREARIGVVFGGSTVFIGGQQIYNKQYWKLPVIYGSLAATAGTGIYFRHQYNVTGKESDKNLSTLMFIGTGLAYWGTLLDGAGNFNKGTFPNAGKATIYSALLPGLGQIYNGEYWKVPIYYLGLVGAGSCLITFDTNYKRFKRIHNEATDPDIEYSGPVQAQTALYYRNVYRRYRDYSIVALAAFYILQVIDANVFSYMLDFDVSDELAIKLSPTIIGPDALDSNPLPQHLGRHANPGLMYSRNNAAVGINLSLKF